jgi:hypothetical protein
LNKKGKTVVVCLLIHLHRAISFVTWPSWISQLAVPIAVAGGGRETGGVADSQNLSPIAGTHAADPQHVTCGNLPLVVQQSDRGRDLFAWFPIIPGVFTPRNFAVLCCWQHFHAIVV